MERKSAEVNDDVISTELTIQILKDLQAECRDENLWHDYMRQIDELESQQDMITRRR